MARKDTPKGPVPVRYLAELDALVGKFLTGETPRIHWVDSRTQFQFDSVEEAVEAMNDPFFRQIAENVSPPTTVLTEVKEFKRYSAEITIAWELVEILACGEEAVTVRRDGEQWTVAFGFREAIAAATAPVAICIAALRMRGVEVERSNPFPVPDISDGTAPAQFL